MIASFENPSIMLKNAKTIHALISYNRRIIWNGNKSKSKRQKRELIYYLGSKQPRIRYIKPVIKKKIT